MENHNGNFELHISSTIFYGNRAHQGGGGAVYIYNRGSYYSGHLFQAELEIHNMTADSNTASSGNGGAMYIYSSGIILTTEYQ